MVPVRVLGLAVDSGAQPVVLLTPLVVPEGPRRFVPIWIGSSEAASIAVAVSGETPPRPLSHDLMQHLLDAVGASIDRVAVTRLDEGTFYAELAVSTPAGRRTIDCRPSDAIALASRTGAPLFVAEAVLEEAGVSEDADEQAEPADEEERVEEFRRFLDDVDPDDFQG